MILNNKNNKNFGFTLIEVLFVIAIVVFSGLVVSNFQKEIFQSGSRVQKSLISEEGGRKIIRNIVSEIRTMNFSAVGGYPIESASSNSLVFYSDVNGDGNMDRIRYFVDGAVLKRGVTFPSGSPLTYSGQPENISSVISGLLSGSVFFYGDTNFLGESDYLIEPINIPLIRLIGIKVKINLDSSGKTIPFEMSSKVSIRNLKDNL